MFFLIFFNSYRLIPDGRNAHMIGHKCVLHRLEKNRRAILCCAGDRLHTHSRFLFL